MELHTKRLTLIPSTEKFASSIPQDVYQLGEHVKAYLNKLKEDSSLYGWGVWFVINKETNKVIGDIGFKGKPDENNTVEIGYGFHPTARNQGFATESVLRLIEWALENNVSKILAECLEDNIPSIKVLEKVGMQRVQQIENMINWEFVSK